MALEDRVVLSRDEVRVERPQGGHSVLQYRIINLTSSTAAIEKIPFQNVQFGDPIAFKHPYSTIEFKEGEESVVVERYTKKRGGDYTKLFINMNCVPVKSSFELKLHVDDNFPLDLSHVWIQGKDGTKYLLGKDGPMSNDRTWLVEKRVLKDDLYLDQFAAAIFEINR